MHYYRQKNKEPNVQEEKIFDSFFESKIQKLGKLFIPTLLIFANLNLANAQSSLSAKLSDPIFHQGLVNENNYETINRFSQNYPKQNTINVGWTSVFRRYNSGETMQNRTALDEKRTSTQMVFDMDGDKPVDWSTVALDSENNINMSAGQYVLALETSNIEREDSPIMLMLLSNQHTVNDYLSNPASAELKKKGYTIAVLEYPNYGSSMGLASLNAWLSATQGAVQFLNNLIKLCVLIESPHLPVVNKV